MSYFNDFKSMLEQGAKTGVEVVDMEQLNNNLLELVRHLQKIEEETKLANEQINNRLTVLEQKNPLTQIELRSELSELRKLTLICANKLNAIPTEPIWLKDLEKKISANQSWLQKISLQIHKDGIKSFIWGWIIFFTIASIAQQIFNINGFSGIWSWIKIITGIKVLFG